MTQEYDRRSVSIRDLFSDTLIYGLSSALSGAIGLALLPVTTAILDPADYGVLSLFGAVASVVYLLVACGVPGAFFRFYAETELDRRRAHLAGSAILLIILQSIAAFTLAAAGGAEISLSLFGIDAVWPALLLVGNGVCAVLIAISLARLQAHGQARSYLALNLISVVFSRGIGLTLLFLGYGPWGWIVGELIGLSLSVLLLVKIAWRRQPMAFSSAVMGETFRYGVLLSPAFISQWFMVSSDKLIMKATLASAEQAIGFYSVGERISSIIIFVNAAFAIAWRRYAFRNMGLGGGSLMLAQGMKLFFVASALMATALALLGDDLTFWLIRVEFAPGIAVIAPLTLAGWLAGAGDICSVGLHQAKRPGLISSINILAAALNVAFNFWAIPRFGIVGAAYATAAAQALRSVAIWLASQSSFHVPLDRARIGTAAAILVVVYFAGDWAGEYLRASIPGTWGQVANTMSAGITVFLAVALLWFFPVLDNSERAAIVRLLRPPYRRSAT